MAAWRLEPSGHLRAPLGLAQPQALQPQAPRISLSPPKNSAYPVTLGADNERAQNEGRTLVLFEDTRGFDEPSDVLRAAAGLLSRLRPLLAHTHY